MNKNFSTKLSHQIGENLAVAELGRRGIIATSFAGNVPEIDILAYKNGISIPIQVKSLKSGSLRTKANYYLNIELKNQKQTIHGIQEGINRDLIFIIVKIGERIGEDVFYVVEQGKIQDLIFEEHHNFLEKHDGIRPRNPSSFDSSVHLEKLEDYKNGWELIERKFDIKSHSKN